MKPRDADRASDGQAKHPLLPLRENYPPPGRALGRITRRALRKRSDHGVRGWSGGSSSAARAPGVRERNSRLAISGSFTTAQFLKLDHHVVPAG